MKKIIPFLFFAFIHPVFAETNLFLSKINKSYPNLNVVNAVYIPNIKLYELTIKDNPKLAYTNESNDFFIIDGEIIDVKNKVNYSKSRQNNQIKEFIASFPIDSAIKVKYGTGERVMHVFTDPDCPFCKAFDREIHSKMKSDNITIYYYLNPLPLTGHENAVNKAKLILCSNSPSQSWIEWMANGNLPQNNGNCSSVAKLDKTMSFSKVNGIFSTPTIIFDNGIVVQKAITVEEIKKAFNYKGPIND